MIRITTLLFAIVSTVTAQQLQPVSLTLEEAVHTAVARHQEVAKAQASAEALKGKIREVRAQALPEITFAGGATRMRDPSFLNSSSLDKFPKELIDALDPVPSNLFLYNVTLKQPLYTSGKVGAALRLASIEAEGSLAEIDRAEQDVALAVTRAFHTLLWAQQYRDTVAATQEQRRRHAAMARTRFENGVATEVDMLRSQVAVANGEPELVRAGNGIRQARAQLNYYLNRAIDFPTEAAGALQPQTWEEWELGKLAAEAYRGRPELNRLRTAERSAEVMLQLAEAEGKFRADLSSEYGIMSRLPDNLLSSKFVRWSLGVNFTLPLFDGFRKSGLVQQAVASRRAARLDRELLERQIELSLQQALDELRAALQTVSAAQDTIREAERVLEMTQANYNFGAATTLDIVDSQTALTLARTNLLRDLYDCSIARANLRWALGRTPWE